MGTFKTGLNKFLGLRQPYNSAGDETGGVTPPAWTIHPELLSATIDDGEPSVIRMVFDLPVIGGVQGWVVNGIPGTSSFSSLLGVPGTEILFQLPVPASNTDIVSISYSEANGNFFAQYRQRLLDISNFDVQNDLIP